MTSCRGIGMALLCLVIGGYNLFGQARLTHDGAFDGEPAWSADGTRIAFVSNHDSGYEIYVMDAEGGGRRRLTDSVPPVYVWDPDWSPDGSRIVYSAFEGWAARTCVMNADGSGVKWLTEAGVDSRSPTWSPDGSQIAFVSNRNGNWDIYTMDADGDNRTRLTTDPAYDGEPAWSPDGLKIVFVSTRNTGGGPAQAQARGATPYIMNVDGSAQYRFTKSTLPVWDLEYSPSGDRIVFSSRHDGNWEIYVMNADGNEQVNLSQSPADDHSPRWAPDDRRIAFVSDRHGNAEIYVLDSVNSADPAASGPRGHDPEPE